DARLHQQDKVNAYFQAQSSYWKEVYVSEGVQAEIYRDRQATVLAWIDSLALAPGSQVLEIGCGAGLIAVALAQRGLRVHAIDSIEAMVELARRYALESGTTESLSVEVGDVYALAFEDESFDLVVAVGVIPWLARVDLAIREMARVTKPGGYVILTADNRARLSDLLDPTLNPVFSPLKRRVKAAIAGVRHRRRSTNKIGATFHDRHFIDEVLASTELIKARGLTLGFGPFSFLRWIFIPEPLGTALHHRLQLLADQNKPIFRSTGAHYIVLTRKLTPQSPLQSTSAERTISDAINAL
ncbi:MAG TPA: class I SAM-dependent methyltransferase, partial [Ktedonobacteraceae bacterium]